MPKKGQHSVGVARQYCGQLGKQENCQVAVTVSLANTVMSVPAGYRLYLPQEWAEDRARREEARVPKGVKFQKKWQIAPAEIDALIEDDLPRAPVVADAGYGVVTEFRKGLAERKLSYAVGVSSEVSVWPPGQQPLEPPAWSGRGRPPKLLRRSETQRPVSVLEMAKQQMKSKWRVVRWREGTKGMKSSRFVMLRVRVAHRDYWRSEPHDTEWLLVEWRTGEEEPTKFWLSNVPATAALEDLVRLVKIRWRIERDYQELKDELGLDHYEGRGWEGFHHHGVLCIAA